MAIQRWDPLTDMMPLRDAIDRMFQESFIRPTGWMSERTGGVPIDVEEDENAFTVTASLPGWKPEDINIQIDGDTVTMSGEYNQPEEREGDKKHRYHVRERSYSSFIRSFSLPTPVDADKADASFDNGELKLTLPKMENAKPRRIAIGETKGGAKKMKSGEMDGSSQSEKAAGKSAK